MSIGTRLYTWLHGELVGTDQFGNRYYRGRSQLLGRPERRWVLYANAGAPDASRVPPEWHRWLHGTQKEPPKGAPVRRAWQKEHQPNLTGTPAAYRPPGHPLKGGQRAGPTGPLGPRLAAGPPASLPSIADLGFTGRHWRTHWRAAYGTTVLTKADYAALPDPTERTRLKRWLCGLRQDVETVFSLLTGLSCAGLVLAADARRHALDPSIRRILDQGFGGFAIDTLGPGGAHDPLSLRGVLLEDAAIRDGFTEKEVGESKQYLVGSIPRNLETNAGIASFLQTVEFYGLGLDYDVRLPSLIQSVTLDQVNAAARRVLHPDRAAVVVAGPYRVAAEPGVLAS